MNEYQDKFGRGASVPLNFFLNVNYVDFNNKSIVIELKNNSIIYKDNQNEEVNRL